MRGRKKTSQKKLSRSQPLLLLFLFLNKIQPPPPDLSSSLHLRGPRVVVVVGILLLKPLLPALNLLATPSPIPGAPPVTRWRQKERTKTTAVALVLCLNIGVDPPDALRISPCARLECWVDPLSMAPPKALETIGKNLQAQYERWQPRARYRAHLDPTLDDVKKLATGARRAARAERVLLHYNGHGVPRPTSNGEVWVFNKSYTQYIPLSVYDLRGGSGRRPSTCSTAPPRGWWRRASRVCDAAGGRARRPRPRAQVMRRPARAASAAAAAGERRGAAAGLPNSSPLQVAADADATPRPAGGGGADPLADIILLAACGAHEALPRAPTCPPTPSPRA